MPPFALKQHLDLSASTEQRASILKEAASSMEKLTADVRQSAEREVQANAPTIPTAQVASEGDLAMSQVIDTLVAINDSSKKIADITGVIDNIAFPANILAWNAAVDAARAGVQVRQRK